MLHARAKTVVSCLVVAGLCLPTVSDAAEREDGVRGARYCEIILSQSKLQFAVYNTMGLNECPDNLWKKLTVAEIKKETGSFFVYLNGPRHFVIDGFKNTELVAKEEKKFRYLSLREAGVLHLSLWDIMMGARPYREHPVDRKTTWIYKAHRPVYELIDPKGRVFVMQSYSLEKKPLTQARLSSLGGQLTLPSGWSYKTGVLKQDRELKAINNKAVVVQDNLLNTYQLATTDFIL